MGFGLADKWVWDFWLAQRREEHHLFYLQAPRSLGVPGLRHHHASIGHAVTTDWSRWEVLPDALRPGGTGAWDDLATWTGSVLEREGRWWMLYTGISRADGGRVQRIGLAVSEDLVRWEKHPANPVLEPDGPWYRASEMGGRLGQSWRDPWLFASRSDGLVHALVTARAAEGVAEESGVIGHARSANLVAWEVLPPLASPGEFSQMEVPQLVEHADGSCTVLFCCLAEDHSPGRRQRLGTAACSGTFSLSAPSFDGPYSVSDSAIGLGSGRGVLYAGKVVRMTDRDLGFMAFRGGGDSEFVGDIVGPFPLAQVWGLGHEVETSLPAPGI